MGNPERGILNTGGAVMLALLFTVVLSAALAVPAFFGARRAEKRGLILIALAVLAALDIWVVQAPRMQVAVTTGGGLAKLAVLCVCGAKIGALDVAFAVALVAVFAALRGWRLGAAAALVQVAAFAAGLAVARLVALPLPGVVFIALGAMPFLWSTRKEWAEMPAGDKASTAVVCGLALVLALAGAAKAIL